MTPHELHRRLRENGYEPTVSEERVESLVPPFRSAVTAAINNALGAGEDRVLVILIDGITGDVLATERTTDHVHPDLVAQMKRRPTQ
jgi:hypothetical protein